MGATYGCPACKEYEKTMFVLPLKLMFPRNTVTVRRGDQFFPHAASNSHRLKTRAMDGSVSPHLRSASLAMPSRPRLVGATYGCPACEMRENGVIAYVENVAAISCPYKTSVWICPHWAAPVGGHVLLPWL